MKYSNIEFHTQDYLQKMIKMSSIRQSIITGLCFTALTSCSFFADGGPQTVVIEANNPSWILHVDGKQVGENGRATVQLDRTRAHVVSATQGNKRVTEMIEMGLSVTGCLDFVGGCFFLIPWIGLVDDAAWKLYPDAVNIDVSPYSSNQ